MPDEFLLKSVVFKLISKEISREEHEYMNIHPPINAVATALVECACPLKIFGLVHNRFKVEYQILNGEKRAEHRLKIN